MLAKALIGAAAGVLALYGSDAGKHWGVERTSYSDPVTGMRVWEVTRAGSTSSNLYFHFPNFNADDSQLIFAGKRGASPQIFRMALDTGEIVQLTDDPRVAAESACPHRANPRLLYYLRGAEVMVMDIFSLQTRRVGTIPPPALGGYGQPTLSGDGRWLALGKQRDPHTWEIGVMDTETGAYRTVITQGFRIGHVQHSPGGPVIFYVWETGGYAPQRSWLVNRDGSGNRPLYAPTDPKSWITPLKEWLTHEAWVQGTGDMTMINDKLGVMLVKPDGSARLVREGRYWHCSARPDGKFIAIDDAEGRVWLAETATGNVRLLATGIRDRIRVHGHVSMSHTGRWVEFNSGRTHETVALIEVSP